MIMAAAEASTCSFFPPLFSSALNDQKNNDDLQKGPTHSPRPQFLDINSHIFMSF